MTRVKFSIRLKLLEDASREVPYSLAPLEMHGNCVKQLLRVATLSIESVKMPTIQLDGYGPFQFGARGNDIGSQSEVRVVDIYVALLARCAKSFRDEVWDMSTANIPKRIGNKISLVKVRWNSKRGPEFTWEHEDYMKSKYPQLFVEQAGCSDYVVYRSCVGYVIGIGNHLVECGSSSMRLEWLVKLV
ncbi:hypothetical protein Tco_0813816 [Tanacetum coccineum]